MKIHTLAAVITVMLTGAAFAQTPASAPRTSMNTPTIDQTQVNQQKRIDQGVASGQLTPEETAKLQKQQAKIAGNEVKAKADGKVTPRERKKLRREQNRANKAIYKKTHNRKVVRRTS